MQDATGQNSQLIGITVLNSLVYVLGVLRSTFEQLSELSNQYAEYFYKKHQENMYSESEGCKSTCLNEKLVDSEELEQAKRVIDDLTMQIEQMRLHQLQLFREKDAEIENLMMKLDECNSIRRAMEKTIEGLKTKATTTAPKRRIATNPSRLTVQPAKQRWN